MELFFGHDLDTDLNQKLTLTPEMIQSLNILQYSRDELVDCIYDMMMENPVIELDNPDYIVKPAGETADMDDSYSDEYNQDEITPQPSEDGNDRDWDAEDWYEYAENMSYSDDSYYGRSMYDPQNSDRYDYMVASGTTLEESLLSQVEMTGAPYMTRAIAAYIIQTLDDNGYMTCSISEIAKELNVSEEDVQTSLKLVWTFEPAGVGARNLAECLELQLKAADEYTEELGMILRDYLEDIAMNRLTAVSKSMGISVYKVQELADLLRSLEPKPGRIYASSGSTNYIIPDVNVENENGTLIASINTSSVPRVIIRSEYKSMLQDAEKNSRVANFLSGRFNSAMWLVRSIEQRNETITKVTQAIVDFQRDFFFKGKSYLKPLTMKEIAEKVGVHESTVSRAVNGKYMQSPQGVYELRYFFSGTGRFTGPDGDSTSGEALKALISSMIEKEDKSQPLSDRTIAEAVAVTGIRISRRTVTKYREELGIPSSSVRRRRIKA